MTTGRRVSGFEATTAIAMLARSGAASEHLATLSLFVIESLAEHAGVENVLGQSMSNIATSFIHFDKPLAVSVAETLEELQKKLKEEEKRTVEASTVTTVNTEARVSALLTTLTNLRYKVRHVVHQLGSGMMSLGDAIKLLNDAEKEAEREEHR